MKPKLPAPLLPVLGLSLTLAAEPAAQTVQSTPHDSLLLPSGITMSWPSPISGSMSDARASVRSMKWIGARKGFLRIGVLRTLRFDGCRIQIASDRGWNQVREWLEAASLSKKAGGCEVEGLEVVRVIDGEIAISLIAKSAHRNPAGHWILREAKLTTATSFREVAQARLTWSQNSITIEADQVPPILLWRNEATTVHPEP